MGAVIPHAVTALDAAEESTRHCVCDENTSKGGVGLAGSILGWIGIGIGGWIKAERGGVDSEREGGVRVLVRERW